MARIEPRSHPAPHAGRSSVGRRRRLG